MTELTALQKYSRALAESILSVTIPLNAISETDIVGLSSQLASDMLKAYEDEGKPYGDSEEGFVQYLLQTKVVMESKEKGDIK